MVRASFPGVLGPAGGPGRTQGALPRRSSEIQNFDSESDRALLPAGPLGAPEITDGLMDLPGRVFGVGGSTGGLYVSHDVYRGRSNPELSQN